MTFEEERKEHLRRERFVERVVKEFELDLTGLNIFMEYATGNYSVVPNIALCAGAANVYLYSQQLNREEHIEKRHWVDHKNYIKKCDIVCNLGRVRPIDREAIDLMKPNTVIAAMMGKDQVRPEDIDLAYCKKKGVPVAYVDEEAVGILSSMGFKMLKAMFAAGLSVWEDRILLYAPGPFHKYYLAPFARNYLVAFDYNGQDLKDFDALVVADYVCDKTVVGVHGIITIDRILKENPLLRIIHISGNIDVLPVVKAGIDIYPINTKEKGHTALTGDYLSYKVTLRLAAAGLKAAALIRRKNENKT